MLRERADSSIPRLGYKWIEPGWHPPGYEAAGDTPDPAGNAWKAMFADLTFVAESDGGRGSRCGSTVETSRSIERRSSFSIPRDSSAVRRRVSRTMS
jgi:hypothetical protein